MRRASPKISFLGNKDQLPKEYDGPSEPTGPTIYSSGEGEVRPTYHIQCTLVAYQPELRDGSIRAFGEQTCNISNQQYITVCLYVSRWWGWQQISCKDAAKITGAIAQFSWGCKNGTYDYQTWADGAFTDEFGIVDAPGVTKSTILYGIPINDARCTG
jgi:hypothetical protein